MDLSKFNAPKAQQANKGFTTTKLDLLLPNIIKQVKLAGKQLDNELSKLSDDQIKAAIDIYMRDIAAYLHTPTASRITFPFGSFKVKFTSIDSFIARAAIPNLKKDRANEENKEKFRTLWKLRQVKYKKNKKASPIQLDNKSLQLSSSFNYNVSYQDTNPTQVILLNAINNLIRQEKTKNQK